MAEYDDLGQQLDALNQEFSALKAPGIFQEKQNPGSRAAYQVQRETLAQRIADLKRRYEASLGNPGAVTGMTSAGMNAPLVPALRFDAPQPTPISVSTGQDFEQDMPIPKGALANVGRKTPRVRPPQRGALPAGVQPSFGGAQESDVAMPLAAEPDVARPAPAAVPAVPEVPQKGLREQYMERLAGMAKGPESTKMTEQQKGMALLEASLAGMAAASKPGASLMGSIGQGGQVGMAAARDIEKVNRAQAERRRAEDIASLHTEMTLAGQDQTRADTKEERAERHKVERERIAREEKRDTITDKREIRKIELLEEAAKANRIKVEKSGGHWIAINRTDPDKSFIIKGADGKPLSSSDEVKEDPLVRRIRAIAGLTGEPVKDVAKSMIKDQSADAADELDTGRILRRFPSAYLGKGENDPKELPARLDALSQAIAQIRGGAAPLPPGVPAGSKQIGTQKGNPVYETPDGRKLVVTPK